MAEKRRQSMKVDVSRCLDSTLSELQLIWDEIGIEESQRDERQAVVLLHLENLLSEMVREEKGTRRRLLDSIDACTSEVATLSRELCLEPYQPESGLTTLRAEKALRQQVDALKRQKKERTDRLEALKHTEQLFCDLLSTTPMYIPTGTVPTDEQLTALQEHIETLRADKAQREETFRETKQSILSLMEQLEQEPNTSFERDVVCEEEEAFSLSMENMNGLKRLQAELETKDHDNARLAERLTEEIDSIWNRLQPTPEELIAEELQKTLPVTGHKPSDIEILQSQLSKLQALKIANLKKVIDATREEIFFWWDKCFYSRAQRNNFGAAYEDEYTEKLLEQHDAELAKMKSYYDMNKTLLESLARREEMWKQMLEFEKKATDPNRFNNRGCVLLQEEKMRSKLNKDLPKLEKVLADKIEQWETQHGTHFLVEGVRFVDYVETQWTTHEQSKKVAKEERLNARNKATEKEMKWGSRPTTPNKRRIPGTPNRTPKRAKGANGTSMASPRLGSSVVHQASPRSVGRPPRTGGRTHLPISSSGANENESPNLHGMSVHIPFPSPADKLKKCRPRMDSRTSPRKLRNSPGRSARRKVLGERNSRREDVSFSTTMHTNSWKSKNSSISSSGSSCPSYTDFTKHLSSEDKPYCLSSSIISSPQRSHSRVTGM